MKNIKFDKLLKKYEFFCEKNGEPQEYILGKLKYDIKNILEGFERRKAINYCISVFGQNSIPGYWVIYDDCKKL